MIGYKSNLLSSSSCQGKGDKEFSFGAHSATKVGEPKPNTPLLLSPSLTCLGTTDITQ